jgi:hypothetical protein
MQAFFLAKSKLAKAGAAKAAEAAMSTEINFMEAPCVEYQWRLI